MKGLVPIGNNVKIWYTIVEVKMRKSFGEVSELRQKFVGKHCSTQADRKQLAEIIVNGPDSELKEEFSKILSDNGWTKSEYTTEFARRLLIGNLSEAVPLVDWNNRVQRPS